MYGRCSKKLFIIHWPPSNPKPFFHPYYEPKHLLLCTNITCKLLPQYHWQGTHPNRLLPEIFFVKACSSFSGNDCVCYTKREQFKLLMFSFGITHTIFTRETLASLYKNISGNSLLGSQAPVWHWPKCWGLRNVNYREKCTKKIIDNH